MKFTGWINLIGFLAVSVLGPPFTGCGEVFQTKTDRVYFAMAAGTLRFLLVSENPFAGG